MENPFERRKPKSPKATRLLEVDAWIDSTIYRSAAKAGEIWESLTIFFRRFRVTGWRRAVIELLSECATLGAGGSVVMLILAIPAFEATEKDWRNQGDFAVTFLDRYGKEVGRRGILHDDSVAPGLHCIPSPGPFPRWSSPDARSSRPTPACRV